jgi:mono/diheme cytochrome c family protein
MISFRTAITKCSLTVAACLMPFIIARAQSSSAIEAGRRIYREGIASGKPVRARVQGDVSVEGARFNCAACHRLSGMGSSEGAAFVPPITARWLFAERDPRQIDLFKKLFQEVQPDHFRARARDPRPRPAYTDETLIEALREGRDPAGRLLDPLMPRYQIGDEDARRLVAYLKTLSAAPSPGVTDSEVHFAAVVTQDADEEKRRAMIDVFDAYLRWKNADTRQMLARSAAWHKDEFYATLREWRLHLWELKGPKENWTAQLEAFYRRQPVFALILGIGSQWQAVHDFCEREELPCLFPGTDLPVTSPTTNYSVYFSRGLTLEADALAVYLRDRLKQERIVQVYRESAPARAFRRAIESQGVSLKDRAVEGEMELTRAFWERLVKEDQPSSLVLWLSYADLKAMDADLLRSVERIYLSSTLLGEGKLPAGLREKALLTHPYALRETPHVYRARAWMRSRGVALRREREQLNAYFALSLVDSALMQMADNFYRDYFLETVEQEAESALNPGVFPSLSLGPGQRFASRGCYIVRLTDTGDMEAVSRWIVP